MEIIFSLEAKTELEEGMQYYNRQSAGLGEQFKTEIIRGLQRVRAWPLATAVEQGEIRRMLLHRFPYKLLYSVEKDVIYILAVAHMHRAPGYWHER